MVELACDVEVQDLVDVHHFLQQLPRIVIHDENLPRGRRDGSNLLEKTFEKRQKERGR